MPKTTGESAGHWPELQRERRALVVVDVVESVRLMQEHEDDFIGRWRRFVNEVRTEVLPLHGGRLVKSLGDGMLLEFREVPKAAAAALQIQHLVPNYNATAASTAAIYLRIGVHIAEVVVDDLDLYGCGVNLAARLATLAGPAEIVASDQARDLLVDLLDCQLTDMGECYVKHMATPVRAFRIESSTGPRPAMRAGPSAVPLLLVLPVTGLPEQGPLLAALSDDLAVAFSRCNIWRTMSRLSTQALRGRQSPAEWLARQTPVDYMLRAQLRSGTSQHTMELALIEARSGEPVWQGEVQVDADHLGRWTSELVPGIVSDLANTLLRQQLRLSHGLALPNVPGYALLLQAVGHLHRLSRTDFERAGAILEHLGDRYPRSADVHGWLAKWHFLRVAQALTEDRAGTLAAVKFHLYRSLDEDDHHGLSLAVHGHLAAFDERDLGKAERLLTQATGMAHSESMGWLFLANVFTHQGRGAEAVRAIEQAQDLSPLDPMRYYFDHFAARAYMADGQMERGLHYAQESIRANGLHLSSLVDLIVTQMLTGAADAARQTARRYMSLRPNASVQRFMDHHAAGDSPRVKVEADALLAAGLPL